MHLVCKSLLSLPVFVSSLQLSCGQVNSDSKVFLLEHQDETSSEQSDEYMENLKSAFF